MALGAALKSTLTLLSDRLSVARDPWWIFGSTALLLAEQEIGSVRDVDVLVSRADAAQLMQIHDWPNEADGGNDRYRSDIFLRPVLGQVPIEIMAGYDIRQGGTWVAMEPPSRRAVHVGAATLFIPDLVDQIALLKALGRPKDLERLAQIKGDHSAG